MLAIAAIGAPVGTAATASAASGLQSAWGNICTHALGGIPSLSPNGQDMACSTNADSPALAKVCSAYHGDFVVQTGARFCNLEA
jgi:hypothetical protein